MNYWVEEFDDEWTCWILRMIFDTEDLATEWINKQTEGEFRIVILDDGEVKKIIKDPRKKHTS